ncbi:MAG: hypothetical protein M1827_004158 [Pycnora praestabilis]|nr:MAG: hypothetical protein M1827_004158 [Pycnora praestabilis]
MGYGATFIYAHGVLCYLNHPTIRVLNVHESSEYEQVIDIPTLIGHAVGEGANYENGTLTLLNYNDGILVVLYEIEDQPNGSWILAVNVSSTTPNSGIVFARSLETSVKVFVRHNASYLYFGTHSGLGSHGHHEWMVTGVSLITGLPLSEKSLQLDDFVGSDLGQTVSFEIYGDYFYAISNQTSFDVEEVDWTSYYHCFRFPLDGPYSESLEVNKKIWRRQHIEGPINDSWTDLRLHIDERTGKLMIGETRREWLEGKSTSQRTYYTQPVTFPTSHSTLSSPIARAVGGPSFLPALPENDVLTTTLTSSDNPHYQPAKTRIPREFHPLDRETDSTTSRSFILTKTKFRAYNASNSAFLDLVDDPLPPSAVTKYRMRQRLRIRVGSRKLKPPARDEEMLLIKSNRNLETGEVVHGSEETFENSPIYMWPLEDAPLELYEILSPFSDGGNEVDGVSDEKCVIYMTGMPYSLQGRAIVLINFDEAICFPGLRKLGPGIDVSAANPGRTSGRTVRIELDRRRARDMEGASQGKAIEVTMSRASASSGQTALIRREDASYLQIGKGLRLR